MAKQYRITPLEKKRAYYSLEMYRKNDDGSVSWFNTNECWRFAQGFLDEDEDVIPYDGQNEIHCRIERGWGCEFDDQISCHFEFSDDLSEGERNEVEEHYLSGGLSWAYDGDHSWEHEHDSLTIVGPYQVDLVDFSTHKVIEENVKFPPKQENPPGENLFPFPTK
jgi:hypothetical protein